MTLNDRLDYLGTTVNIAARLGSFSGGGDVVASDLVRHLLVWRVDLDCARG